VIAPPAIAGAANKINKNKKTARLKIIKAALLFLFIYAFFSTLKRLLQR
jgi:hypothetical protein